MKIYLDVLFIENVLCTYVVLNQTAFLLLKKPPKNRIALASILSSLYITIIIVTKQQAGDYLLTKLLLMIVVIYISFAPSSIKEYIKTFGVMYLATIITAGVVTIISNQLQYLPIAKLINVGLSYVISLTLSKLFVYKMWKIYKVQINKENLIQKITLYVDNQPYVYTAFVDTGNNVYSSYLNQNISFAQSNNIDKNKLKNIKQGIIKINSMLKEEEKTAYVLKAYNNNNKFDIGIVFIDDELSANGKYDMILNYNTYLEQMGGINV